MLLLNMPRNKNPNPSRVTDELTGEQTATVPETSLKENEDEKKDQTGEDNNPSDSEFVADLNTENDDSNDIEVGFDQEKNSDTVEEELITPDVSPPLNVKLEQPDVTRNAITERLIFESESKSTRIRAGGKPNTWAMLNSGPLEWVCQRFTLKEGRHISASAIIDLYKEEVVANQEFPIPLHNYQVGQMLKRIFPNLTRCKVTRNGKRTWVYRDLCPKDLTDEEKLMLVPKTSPKFGFPENENNKSSSDFVKVESPSSHSEQNDENDDNTQNVKNEILRGLLNGSSSTYDNQHRKSPNSVRSDKEETDADPQKVKILNNKDSEVQKWLFENYKYKEGYFVKSYDLLRRYNHGRVEMVKYLSQVGRVMKSVFPDVKHQRKSFCGGKREWVYLNLKPIDVESDSEESKCMQLYHMKKASKNLSLYKQALKANNNEDWKQDSVNITHMPLSMVHKHAHSGNVDSPLNNLPQRTYFPTYKVKSMVGKKLIIRRENGSDINQGDCDSDGDQKISGRTISESPFLKKDYEQEAVFPTLKSDDQFKTTDDSDNVFATFGNKRQYNNDHPFYAPSNGFDENQSKMKLASLLNNGPSKSDTETQEHEQWASKRLKLCASDIASSQQRSSPDLGKPRVLNLSINSDQSLCHKNDKITGNFNNKHEKSAFATINYKPNSMKSTSEKISKLDNMINLLHSGNSDKTSDSLQRGTSFLNDTREDTPISGGNTHKVIDLTLSSERNEQFHTNSTSPLMFALNKISGAGSRNDSNDSFHLQNKSFQKINDHSYKHHSNHEYESSFKRNDPYTQKQPESDSLLNWEFLQMYTPQQFGWIRSCQTTHVRFNGKSRQNKFIEYIMINGQWLVNGHRVIREVKIYSDWNVSIHVLGRRVYPDVLNGITDLEKSKSSLDKVFRVLSNAQVCMGFHAKSINDLYIHGILVSKSEVWSSREEVDEEVRQRAVNCQILFNGNNISCSKCDRIQRLYNQQRNVHRK